VNQHCDKQTLVPYNFYGSDSLAHRHELPLETINITPEHALQHP